MVRRSSSRPLAAALSAHRVIARGVESLMRKHSIDEHRAYRLLAQMSEETGRSVFDLAEEQVDPPR